MYQYWGNIFMYSFFNKVAVLAFFVFNLLNFRYKRNMLSKFSLYCIDRISESKKPSFFSNVNLWTFIEILVITFFQYVIAYGIGVNNIFSLMIGTGSNYYGTLFLSPLFLQLIFLALSVKPLKQMDLITPAYPFALIFVKLACFLQGCCEGVECSFGLYFPSNDAVMFPTQLLEAGLALLIFLALVIFRKKFKEGTVYPIYLIVYSATRFFSEFTRLEENVLGPFKLYHFVCIFGIIMGVIQLTIIKKNKERILALHERSSYIMIDFINVAAEGFGFRKEKSGIQHKKSGWKKKNKVVHLSEKKFEFKKIKIWIIIWTLGLVGQIGWSVEGTWFNTFVYDKVDKNPSILTPMLILSALASSVAILLLGTLTDRTGKRRNLVSTGFIVWGVLLCVFGLTQFLARSSIMLAVVVIVILDMLLSVFASMSTDVGYSTWLTDVMNKDNAGQIGAAIAVQVVLGSLLGNIIGGLIVGSRSRYITLFMIMGLLLCAFGILSVYFYDKSDDVKPSVQGSFSSQISNALDFKSIFKQKELIWIYVTITVFFIGFNTYFPHLGNYLLLYIGYSPERMGIVQAIPLVLAMTTTIPATKYINNNRFLTVASVAIVSGLIGMLFLFPTDPEKVNTGNTFNIRILGGIFFAGVSYVIMLQATKTWTKKLSPSGSKGQFEVFYAISYALIPTLFGSTFGEHIIKKTGMAIFNYGTERYEYIPNGNIFLVGILISTLSIIPIFIASRLYKKNLKENTNE